MNTCSSTYVERSLSILTQCVPRKGFGEFVWAVSLTLYSNIIFYPSVQTQLIRARRTLFEAHIIWTVCYINPCQKQILTKKCTGAIFFYILFYIYILYTGGLNHLFRRIIFSIHGHGKWIVFHFHGLKKL